MALNKRPGVYFTETTGTVVTDADDFIPLFIVQTSTAIPAIDDQIIEYTSIDTFATVVEDKGLTKTVKYMAEALTEAGAFRFYVYSIKTDTLEGFTNAIKNCAGRTEIRDIIYIEETASAQANSISNKINAIKTALADNYTKGTPRTSLIVPYGTVSAAIEDATETLPKTTVITQLTSILNGVTSGRVSVAVPDDVTIGATIGKFIGRADNEEIGANAISTTIPALTYNFDDTEILTLLNLGCLVVTSSYRRGTIQYNIEAGVTTSIKTDSADQLLISRSIADAVLRDVKIECDSFLKQKISSDAVTMLQSDINTIISTYVSAGDVVNEGTKLTVTQSNVPYTLNVQGTIQPVGSILVINVDTTINV